MLKIFLLLTVFLPVIGVLIGVLFGVANIKGMIALAVVYTALMVWMLVHQEMSLVLGYLMFLGVVLIPLLGAALSFVWPAKPGPAPIEEVKKAYDDLTLEQKAAINKTAKAFWRAGMRTTGDHLRKKGNQHLGDAFHEIAK